MNTLSRAVLQQTRVMLKDVSALTATGSSTGLDVSVYEGVLAFSQIVGTVSGTTPTLDGKIETSDASGSGYVTAKTTTAVDATFTQVTASNSLQVVFCDCDALKQYARWTYTIAGTTPSFTAGCMLVGVKKYQ